MQDGIFKTDDTPLAAFLVTEGFPLRDIVFKGRFANFLFDGNDLRLQELIKDFQLLRAQTNAAQLIFNYKALTDKAKRGVGNA